MMYWDPNYEVTVTEEQARKIYEYGMQNHVWRSDFTYEEFIKTHFE